MNQTESGIMQVNSSADVLYGQPGFQKLQADVNQISNDVAPSSKPVAAQSEYNPYQSASVVSETRSIAAMAISYAKQGEDSVQAVNLSSDSVGKNIDTRV